MPKSKKLSLTKIGNLLEGALRRHGVAKQVTAAMIIDRTNEVLDELLGASALRSDVNALSIVNGTLVIACRNAGASYDIDGMIPELKVKLREEIPEADIHTIIPRVHIERQRF